MSLGISRMPLEAIENTVPMPPSMSTALSRAVAPVAYEAS